MYITWWTLVKVWIAYALPFLPFLPEIGDERKADCIFAQAFGRNGIDDKNLGFVLWSLRAKTHKKDQETFAILKKQGFKPGAANRAIAWHCITQFVNHLGLPLIAQWEIVYTIWEIDPDWYKQNQTLIDCLWPPVKGYFSTFYVGLAAMPYMSRRGCSRPLNVAHPAMAVRAAMILWRLGIKPVAQRIPMWKFWKHPLWVWDKNSVQIWTKIFIPHWLIRETPGRAYVALQRNITFIPPR